MKNQITVRRAKITIVVLCSIAILLVGTRLYLEESLATRGEELGRMQNQINTLDEENNSLKQKLYQTEALTVINEQARSAGFVDATYYILK